MRLVKAMPVRDIFVNRAEAGKRLATELKAYARKPSTVVLGIPRGGVVVAYEVARALQLPLDIFVVRKLGLPDQPELAMGALGGGGFYLLNQDVVEPAGISEQEIQAVLHREQQELERRERVYRQGHPRLPLTGKSVILVDDGLATGASVRVAIRMLRQECLRKLILAVPVAPPDTCESLKTEVDDLVCLLTPEPFYSIGRWYEDFAPTPDADVCDLLQRARTTETSV